MKKILIVIDVQNDFIDGSLGSAEAQAIYQMLKIKLNNISPMVIKLFLQEIHITQIILELKKVKNFLYSIVLEILMDGKLVLKQHLDRIKLLINYQLDITIGSHF